ncbi:MAG: hypothetical protein COB73_07565 [Flavobacteriaceae bacterium]|nr:MAG: hypothetical protein COB73_07565 [Flavobacteriaceae bacterium]
MKKVILFILLAGFLTTANAQKQTHQEKKAKVETAYVAGKMKMDKDRAAFLQDVLLEKYATVSKEIKGKNLSKEEKKVIRKSANKATNSKLTTQFSKAEVKEITSYIKEFNANKKK